MEQNDSILPCHISHSTERIDLKLLTFWCIILKGIDPIKDFLELQCSFNSFTIGLNVSFESNVTPNNSTFSSLFKWLPLILSHLQNEESIGSSFFIFDILLSLCVKRVAKFEKLLNLLHFKRYFLKNITRREESLITSNENLFMPYRTIIVNKLILRLESIKLMDQRD
ncbi:hypothetical protein BpHYR1_042210 [Brachionus plicatilis]|uniref:Uncharacterized protein n=1 Tax=Brachionus plicatilis TaxID=10195 RepID=A0A3M7QBQ9_BRAPC|nr:hypothetical protein BpHYR1_042210 [Brachionus plicatilis]